VNHNHPLAVRLPPLINEFKGRTMMVLRRLVYELGAGSVGERLRICAYTFFAIFLKPPEVGWISFNH
jgi:hypothetical protein